MTPEVVGRRRRKAGAVPILTSGTFASLVAECADDSGTSTVTGTDSDTSGVTTAGVTTPAPAIRPSLRGSDVAALVAPESVAQMVVRAAIRTLVNDPSPGAVVVGVWGAGGFGCRRGVRVR